MQAVTFQAPRELRVVERAAPSPVAADDAVVAVEATGVCGSDLHIYHGRVPVEQGFTIGHEFVGMVLATGAQVRRVAEGDRVLGCFCTACGDCFFCARGEFHRCEHGRTFGHGAAFGSLQGAQAERVLVPHANLTLRRVPPALSSAAALFAGDVLGSAYHAVSTAGLERGGTAAVIGLGPVGLCSVQVARAMGAREVIAVDSVAPRLEMASSLGATPAGLGEGDVRAVVREATDGRGADVTVEAVGHADAFELACRLTRKGGTVSALGVYAERRMEVPMGLVWLKGLTVRTGYANVIGHVDAVLELMLAGKLDPTPLVTHRMRLDDAPEAYALYDRREALKIILEP